MSFLSSFILVFIGWNKLELCVDNFYSESIVCANTDTTVRLQSVFTQNIDNLTPWHKTIQPVLSVCLSHTLQLHHADTFKVQSSLTERVLLLAGTVSTAGPQGNVPGKVFTAVCSVQTRQQSSSTKVTVYVSHWDVCGLGICAGGYWHVLVVLNASSGCEQCVKCKRHFEVWQVLCLQPHLFAPHFPEVTQLLFEHFLWMSLIGNSVTPYSCFMLVSIMSTLLLRGHIFMVEYHLPGVSRSHTQKLEMQHRTLFMVRKIPKSMLMLFTATRGLKVRPAAPHWGCLERFNSTSNSHWHLFCSLARQKNRMIFFSTNVT